MRVKPPSLASIVILAGFTVSASASAQPVQATPPLAASRAPTTPQNLVDRFLSWQAKVWSTPADTFNEDLVLLGVLQAAVAAFQLVTYRRQARIMDKQADISTGQRIIQEQQGDFARTMALLTQRAVISFKGINWDLDQDAGFWRVSISLQNYGPIPAQDVMMSASWETITPDALARFEPSFDVGESAYLPIPPGLVFPAPQLSIPAVHSLSTAPAQDGAGTLIAVCYLRVRYRDMFSKHKHLRSSDMEHRVQLCFTVMMLPGQTEDTLYFQPIARFCSDEDL